MMSVVVHVFIVGLASLISALRIFRAKIAPKGVNVRLYLLIALCCSPYFRKSLAHRFSLLFGDILIDCIRDLLPVNTVDVHGQSLSVLPSVASPIATIHVDGLRLKAFIQHLLHLFPRFRPQRPGVRGLLSAFVVCR